MYHDVSVFVISQIVRYVRCREKEGGKNPQEKVGGRALIPHG